MHRRAGRPSAILSALLALIAYPISGAQAQRPIDASDVGLGGRYERVASCSPSEAATNNILLLWNAVQADFAADLRTIEVPKERTSNCNPSIVIIPTNAGAAKYAALLKVFEAGLEISLTRPNSPVPACAPGDSSCCIPSPYLNCMLDYQIFNTDIPLTKVGFKVFSLQAVAAEVASNSFVVALDQFSAAQLPGDALLFAWPYPVHIAGLANPIVVTRVDGELMLRLAYAARHLLPKFRVASDAPATDEFAYRCEAAGLSPAKRLKAEMDISDFVFGGFDPNVNRGIDIFQKTFEEDRSQGGLGLERIRLSTGKPIPLRAPPGSPAADGAIVVTVRDALATVQVEDVGGPALDSIPAKMPDFAKSISQGPNPFSCFGSALFGLFKDPTAVRIINDSNTALFLFGAMYLNGIVRELHVSEADPANDEGHAEFALDPSAPRPRRFTAVVLQAGLDLRCHDLCRRESPRCLLVNYARYGDPNALETVAGEFRKDPPFQISPQRLMTIFGRSADDLAVRLRGPTVMHDDSSVTNEGAASTIEVDVGEGVGAMSVRIDVPPTVRYRVSRSATTSVQTFSSDGEGLEPLLKFSQAIIDNRFGGHIRQVDLDDRGIIWTTTNGCIETPYHDQRAALSGRLAATAGYVGYSAALEGLDKLMAFVGGDKDDKPLCKIGPVSEHESKCKGNTPCCCKSGSYGQCDSTSGCHDSGGVCVSKVASGCDE